MGFRGKRRSGSLCFHATIETCVTTLAFVAHVMLVTIVIFVTLVMLVTIVTSGVRAPRDSGYREAGEAVNLFTITVSTRCWY